MIVGWRVATTLRTELALDALEMAVWAPPGHRPGRTGPPLATAAASTSPSATPSGSPTAGAVASVGSRGDSYDNALAETVNGLYKTELIRRHGPWRSLDHVELATLAWVDWCNHRRLLEPSATSHRPSTRPPTV